MPELPEVETVRRGLEARVVGRRVSSVEVGRERTVRRTSRDAVISGLTGTTITAASRRGKYLVLSLDTGDAVMVHLRMSGQLLVDAVGAVRPLHTHVVAVLEPSADHPVAEELRFVDPRTFGEVVVFDPDEAATDLPELAALGIDPIADGITRSQLRGIVLGRDRQMKALLLDQHVIAGIGNIYADEILHRARVHPAARSSMLTGQQITRLHAAIVDILSVAIEAGGSTLRDAQYVDLMGESGEYQDSHRVYGREGLPCITCGKTTIRRLVTNGRSTHFCPRCQRP